MSSSVISLSPQTLRERWDAGEGGVLLDVRQPEERVFAVINAPDHIVDLHIPMNMIPLEWPRLLPKLIGKPLAVYCHHGVRSRIVAEWIASQLTPEERVGPICNLEGGIDRWTLEMDNTIPRY